MITENTLSHTLHSRSRRLSILVFKLTFKWPFLLVLLLFRRTWRNIKIVCFPRHRTQTVCKIAFQYSVLSQASVGNGKVRFNQILLIHVHTPLSLGCLSPEAVGAPGIIHGLPLSPIVRQRDCMKEEWAGADRTPC